MTINLDTPVGDLAFAEGCSCADADLDDRGIPVCAACAAAWEQLESVEDASIIVFDADGYEVHRGSLFEFCAVNAYSPQQALDLRRTLYTNNGAVQQGGGAAPVFTIQYGEPI